MRFIVQVTFPPKKFNKLVRKGTAGETLGAILEDIKPESVYFISSNGHRGAIMTLDMTDASQIPVIAEPFFLKFDATVTFNPCMTPADLEAAGLDDLGQKWG